MSMSNVDDNQMPSSDSNASDKTVGMSKARILIISSLTEIFAFEIPSMPEISTKWYLSNTSRMKPDDAGRQLSRM